MRYTSLLSVVLLALFSQLATKNAALADTLFGVISERNSATAAAAAASFKQRYPNAAIILRTPRQLATLEDSIIVEMIANSDTFLVAGVFGDNASRLGRLIDASGKRRDIMIVSSTKDLAVRSRDQDGKPTKDVGRWLQADAYWQARGTENVANLFAWLLLSGPANAVPAPKPLAPVRIGKRQGEGPTIALLDYDTGDQAGNIDLHTALCTALKAQDLSCLSVFADWGAASADAVEHLADFAPAGIILMQDFAVGGSQQKRAEAALTDLGAPLLKAIRLNETEEEAWQTSQDGLPTDSVYYRVAMPELVGASQPMVLAAGAPPKLDPTSGIEIRVTAPIVAEVAVAARRMKGWTTLQTTTPAEKRLAIIYYNHPPGRHNIGADNLDVPASLFEILTELQEKGYDVGDLPASPEELLALIQARAVNLPEDGAALEDLAKTSFSLSLNDYDTWFATLPSLTQAEMTGGALAALKIRIKAALDRQQPEQAQQLLADAVHDMAFVIEGAPAKYHERAESLLDQLDDAYRSLIGGEDTWDTTETLSRALMNQGIEGLRGWGDAPGKVMTHDGNFVFPGIRFGNILIAPQPPRGWEVNEEVLHANMSVPPTHQYLAFYRWLQSEFKPHALIHLGRHSTYEFMPGKRVGLAATDYSRLIAGDTPGLYPYIVDGVGEGLQAKRRGLAVIVDHLTPPLAATPFYDELLGLRQLVESFEAADPSEAGDAARAQALGRIKAAVIKLGIKDALVAELEAEHGGGETIEFETIAPDLLVHEVGHFLTEMQEDFMPLGLHVFGKDWSKEAVDTMLTSMGDMEARADLIASPAAEITALLEGLEGRFVRPGKGNDPLRSPDALPTGRNFYGLDASLVPNLVAWDIGSTMAASAPSSGDGQAVVLWASDTVRDGGVMMAFGLKQLGLKPVWNGRGILKGLERLPAAADTPRQDVTFVASGLFRDLYGEQLKWLDKAVLLALDGASQTIEADYPLLAAPLAEALAPLGELRLPGNEPLELNAVASAWVADMAAKESIAPGDGRTASLRMFAPAPGRYGAGINRLAERSGAWRNRSELAQSYVARMGHAYGIGVNGSAAQSAFTARLKHTSESFLGRASNLYGLVDNNDAFDYLGGLNMAVEAARGTASRGYVVDVSDPDNPETAPLARAIVQELRGRQLNPNWIKSLMPHGYAGARTMNSAFFENLWGWEATDPNLFPDSIWDDAKAIYIDDRYGIGVSAFLEENAQKPVKANILAVMLVAAHKGFWDADEATINDLATAFAQVVVEAGLPGSGHTRPDHPMLDWIDGKLPEDLAAQLRAVRDAARGDVSVEAQPPQMIRELTTAQQDQTAEPPFQHWWLWLLLAGVISAGIYLGRRTDI